MERYEKTECRYRAFHCRILAFPSTLDLPGQSRKPQRVSLVASAFRRKLAGSKTGFETSSSKIRRMRYRRFGRTGWEVSEIGYGMWGMAGWTGSEDEQSLASLDRAV